MLVSWLNPALTPPLSVQPRVPQDQPARDDSNPRRARPRDGRPPAALQIVPGHDCARQISLASLDTADLTFLSRPRVVDPHLPRLVKNVCCIGARFRTGADSLASDDRGQAPVGYADARSPPAVGRPKFPPALRPDAARARHQGARLCRRVGAAQAGGASPVSRPGRGRLASAPVPREEWVATLPSGGGRVG